MNVLQGSVSSFGILDVETNLASNANADRKANQTARGVMIPVWDPDSELDFQPFGYSISEIASRKKVEL